VTHHYIFNVVVGDTAQRDALSERVAGLLRTGLWGVDDAERHRDSLAARDLVLVYLGAPAREFVGRAVLASAVHTWTPAEARAYPGEAASGVVLARVEEWAAPVPMPTVLAELASPSAKADFDAGVVESSAHEYETVLALAANTRG
jgi:hypothetical protein